MNCSICLSILKSNTTMCENCDLYKSFKTKSPTKRPFKYVKYDIDNCVVKRLVDIQYILKNSEYDTEEEVEHPKQRRDRNEAIQAFNNNNNNNNIIQYIQPKHTSHKVTLLNNDKDICKCGINILNICQCINPICERIKTNNQLFCNSCNKWMCRC